MGNSPRGCKELDTTERLHFTLEKCLFKSFVRFYAELCVLL